MSKKKTFLFFSFPKFSFITLFVGAILGILSQHNPELRAYTQEVIRPIENSNLFKQLKNKISPHDSTDSSTNYQTSYYQYAQEYSLPGQPISSFIIHRPGYSLAYDAHHRNPKWVYEHLTAESIRGDIERSLEFKEDQNIPQQLRATLADYKGSGFDRGHQAPAADHRSNSEAMADTFFMTNMCPQCPQLNRGYWRKVEKYVRDLTKTYQNVFVITGPLYVPYNEGEKRFVKYQVIGQNNVAVPTHFFKIVILEDWQGVKESKAYLIPNQEICPKTPLDHFKTTIQKIEKLAGFVLSK